MTDRRARSERGHRAPCMDCRFPSATRAKPQTKVLSLHLAFGDAGPSVRHSGPGAHVCASLLGEIRAQLVSCPLSPREWRPAGGWRVASALPLWPGASLERRELGQDHSPGGLHLDPTAQRPAAPAGSSPGTPLSLECGRTSPSTKTRGVKSPALVEVLKMTSIIPANDNLPANLRKQVPHVCFQDTEAQVAS